MYGQENKTDKMGLKLAKQQDNKDLCATQRELLHNNLDQDVAPEGRIVLRAEKTKHKTPAVRGRSTLCFYINDA